jgi:hypothetical protein
MRAAASPPSPEAFIGLSQFRIGGRKRRQQSPANGEPAFLGAEADEIACQRGVPARLEDYAAIDPAVDDERGRRWDRPATRRSLRFGNSRRNWRCAEHPGLRASGLPSARQSGARKALLLSMVAQLVASGGVQPLRHLPCGRPALDHSRAHPGIFNLNTTIGAHAYRTVRISEPELWIARPGGRLRVLVV